MPSLALARRALVLLLVWASPYADLLRLHEYDQRDPIEIDERGVEQRNGVAIHDVSYASPKGGSVTAYVVVPPGEGPFAGILFMHGGDGNRGSLLPGALVFARTGAVCLLIDSPLNGARAIPGERLADFSKPERTRDAMIQTVVDLRRGVDLLLARTDVDPKRIGYIGASYGGTIGGVLAGVEKRIRAYVLMVGTGDIGDFIRESRHPTAVRARTSLTPEEIQKSTEILDPVQPIHYIGRAAPSALFFQNGRRDPFMPIPAVERYQNAGSEPKKVKWYDAGHRLNAEATFDRAAWLSQEIGIGPLPMEVRKRLQAGNAR